MISFFYKYKKIILVAIIACFLGSLGYVGAGAVNEEYGLNAPVAKVGKEKIKYKDYDREVKNLYRTLEAQETEEEDTLAREYIKQEVLNSLIVQSSLKQEALNMGLGASDIEMVYIIQNDRNFNTSGSFNKTNYFYVLRRVLGMTPEEFENKVRDSILAEEYKQTLILAAKTSPQEEAFVKSTLLAGQKFEDEKMADQIIMTQKAQTLANNFSQDFNQRNMITFTRLAPSYQQDQAE